MVKLITLRMILAVAVQKRCFTHQMDVKTALSYGKLKENVFMALPAGLNAAPGLVYQLQKSLYYLK